MSDIVELLEDIARASCRRDEGEKVEDDYRWKASREILSLRTALSTAREEGRREGIEEAWAKIDKVYRDLGYAPNYSHLADLRALQAKEGER